ncbi:hypothetical protein [Asaia lannensis]|uniref:hypothetical protein n=1 Tax=Asaia lannensis TaxID=415421 RepID=UPI0038739776
MNIETGQMSPCETGALVADLSRNESTEAFLVRYSEMLKAIVTHMAEQGATQDSVRNYVREFANGAWVRREELAQHHAYPVSALIDHAETVP